jgi:hypothetical protein
VVAEVDTNVNGQKDAPQPNVASVADGKKAP